MSSNGKQDKQQKDGSQGDLRVEKEEKQGEKVIFSKRNCGLAILFCTALLVIMVIALERAGVTEKVTDIRFEEFLANAGWTTFNETSYAEKDSKRPGYQLAQQGARAKYPVVIIPGFVTSGLELWQGKKCAQKYFRKRMWGGIGTARQLFAELECWLQHLSLDPLTGMDPPDIRLRPAQGFEAADYFMANYWVWGKLIENLADLGYDGSLMTVESYDWRLAFSLVDKRDGYFTRLRYNIEAMHKIHGKKVVLTSHSMGSQVATYFFAWVTTPEEKGGGGGGANWVDENIHAFVNIAGPMLGVPKAAPALLSGEMRDTSKFIGVFGSMMEQFFGRRLRKDLWMTWGSLWAMLPMGGSAIWGVGADMCNASSPCEGLWCRGVPNATVPALVPLIQLTDSEEDLSNSSSGGRDMYHCEPSENDDREQMLYISKQIDKFSRRHNHTVEETVDFLSQWGGGNGPSTGKSKAHTLGKSEKPNPRTWSDPSRTPLPHAPKMKIYCLYGVGLRTERAYFYMRNAALREDEPRLCNNSHFDPPLLMNTSVTDEEHDIENGVKFSDGDGSVPLLSLGYLCVDGWKRKELNPSGSKVITREYPNKQEFQVDDPMRGGPRSAEHVDILGHVDLTEDYLRIVSDFGVEGVDSHIVSDIERIAKRINDHPDGGILSSKSSKNILSQLYGSIKGKP